MPAATACRRYIARTERRQIERWREMTPAEKAAIVSGLTNAVYELAHAGIRQRYPDASPREQFLRLPGSRSVRRSPGALIPTPPACRTRDRADRPHLARRQAVRLAGDRVLHVHPPEDILLQKLRWYEKSGTVSGQWRDILGIIRVQGPRLDLACLIRNAPDLGVSASLERALREGPAG